MHLSAKTGRGGEAERGGGRGTAFFFAAFLLLAPTHAPVHASDRFEEGGGGGVRIAIGGDIYHGLYWLSHDDIKGDPDNVMTVGDLTVKNNESVVALTGDFTNDKGITIGLKLEFAIDGDLEEHYIFMEGAFGRLEFGAPYAVSETLHYTAPEFVPNNSIDYPYAVNISRQSADLATFIIATEADYKVSFYTPRLIGLRFGFSYVPTLSEARGNNGLRVPIGSQSRAGGEVSGSPSDIFLFAASYFGAVARHWDIGVSAAYGYNDGFSASGDVEYVSAGMAAIWRGLRFGAAYKYQRNVALRGAKDHVWAAGFSYRYRAWEAGVAWRHSLRRGAGAKKINWGAQAGGTYHAGGGLRLGLDVQYLQDRDPDMAGQIKLDSLSAGVIIGVSF